MMPGMILFMAATFMEVRITADVINNITSRTADCSYSRSITNVKVLEHGVCVNTEGVPELEKEGVKVFRGEDQPRTDPGVSRIKSAVTLTRLEPATKYFLRAWVKTADGETEYSNETWFTTR